MIKAVVEKGAVHAVEVLDRDQPVFHLEPAVSAAHLAGGNADLVAVGAADASDGCATSITRMRLPFFLTTRRNSMESL